MDIGKKQRVIIVEPLEEPNWDDAPADERVENTPADKPVASTPEPTRR